MSTEKPQPAVGDFGKASAPVGNEGDQARIWKEQSAAGRLRTRIGPFGVPIALVILIIFFQTENSSFLTGENIKAIFETAALPAIAACGLTVVLVLNEFDLSFQAVAGFATIAFAVLTAKDGWALVPAIAAVLAIGAFIGMLNGGLVAYARLAALVVTIGMGSLLNGGEFTISKSETLSGYTPGFVSFCRGAVGPVPNLAIAALVAAAIIWLLLERTPLGREMRAVGSNPEAARFAGVDVRRTVLIGFVVTATAATAAGILYAGHQGTAYPLSGLTILLQSFAACFIGAAMFRIGEFNIPGTIVGSVLAAVVSNGLLLANVAGYATYFFQGGILIAAVLFARIIGGKTEEL